MIKRKSDLFMGLYILTGYMGSGKTLLSTDMCLTSKVPVIANYDIGNFRYDVKNDRKVLVERNPNTHLLDLGQLLHLPYNKCKVVLDEAYSYLESRVSMSKLNLYMSYILFQSRKRGIDFIITAQLSSSIDNRFIDLADCIIGCKQKKDGFYYYIGNGRSISVMKIPIKKAERIWEHYDTSQVIMPQNIKELETQIDIMDKKVLKKRLDELEKKFRSEYGNLPKITYSIVDNFLLDMEEEDIFRTYLYSRLNKVTKF
jgi:hypothetical protein